MRAVLKLALCGSAMVAALPLHAETLREALVQAYNSNPTLTGARAGQRATDEGVPIAKAQGRPDLDGTATYSELFPDLTAPISAPTGSFPGSSACQCHSIQGEL